MYLSIWRSSAIEIGYSSHSSVRCPSVVLLQPNMALSGEKRSMHAPLRGAVCIAEIWACLVVLSLGSQSLELCLSAAGQEDYDSRV